MVVTTHAQLAEMVAFIEASHVTYDIETTGTNPRRDRIIGIGVGTASRGYYLPVLVLDNNGAIIETGLGRAGAIEVVRALARSRFDAFNGSFEIQFTINDLSTDLTHAFDTEVMLLVHTCDENWPAYELKFIARQLWGESATLDEAALLANIKQRGGKDKGDMIRADVQVLANYCIADCMLTARIKEYYLPSLKKQGLYDFFYVHEVMPLYREVTIPMEMRGVRLDMPKLHASLAALNEDIAKLEDEVQTAIAPHLELFTQWFLNKDYPLVTYKTKKPSAWTRKHKTQFDAWQADNPGAYMFNLTSPHHKKKLFFDTLREEPLSRTPTGQPQCNEDFLEAMAAKYDWCKTWITYNKLTKLRGSYVERFISESEEGRFYPSWFQHRTVSGRFAGDLQQLPRPVDGDDVVARHTNVIREFIIADNGCKLISADYEQLEPTIFSHTSGDTRLQQIFNSGADFYSTVAIRTEGLSGSAEKTSVDYLGKINKQARQKAKAYSLGIAYGMTGYKLKFEIGVSEEEADKLVQDYLAAFPDLARWMHESRDRVCYTGQVSQQLGRIRHMPRAAAIWKKYGARINDPLGLWKDYNKQPAAYELVKKDYKEFKNYMNNAINFQVQSLAASIANRACIAVARALRSSGSHAYICMQCHDEIVANCPDSEIDTVSKLVQDIMQNVVKLSVPLRTVPQAGKSFKDCK